MMGGHSLKKDESVGVRIRQLRTERKLTQKQLAEKAGIAEISLRQYEAGKRAPTFLQVEKLVNALDLEFDWQQLSKGETMSDLVNHPSHYTQGKVECIDALEAATQGLQGLEAVCTANAIKYLWRWKKKNGIEDLQKAIWYITKLIERLEP